MYKLTEAEFNFLNEKMMQFISIQNELKNLIDGVESEEDNFYSILDAADPTGDFKAGHKYTKTSSADITLELEPSGDENMCAYPFIIEEEDKYIMFYNGSNFGKGGISYAELKK